MFTTIIVQPIFNLLVFITAVVPGHNFGLAIILFTIVVRLLMWPLVRKQLHHARAMRELQPELKRIKKAAAGDRQKESQLMMELYKEKEINPFSSLGILIVQLPILIGLYASIRRIINDPHQITTFSYSFLHHLGWIQHLAGNIHQFDNSLFGLVNLTRTAAGTSGVYWPAMIIVIASAIAQYLQSKQLMPSGKESRSLRAIMREAGEGKTADQTEVNAAVSRSTVVFIPIIVFLVSLHLAVALPLYWLVSSTMAYLQQARVLERDVSEEEAIADAKPIKVKKARALPQPKAKPVPAGVKVTRTTLKDYSQNRPAAGRKKRSK
jgi:YidC/Oxa1 family membrane protein insertase